MKEVSSLAPRRGGSSPTKTKKEGRGNSEKTSREGKEGKRRPLFEKAAVPRSLKRTQRLVKKETIKE